MFIVVNNFYGSTLDCNAEAPLLDGPSLPEVITNLTNSLNNHKAALDIALEALCKAGRKIHAIMAYRKAAGCGLRMAREYVDELEYRCRNEA